MLPYRPFRLSDGSSDYSKCTQPCQGLKSKIGEIILPVKAGITVTGSRKIYVPARVSRGNWHSLLDNSLKIGYSKIVTFRKPWTSRGRQEFPGIALVIVALARNRTVYAAAELLSTRRCIEVVITGLTRNQVARKGSWVRIPPPPPKVLKAHAFRTFSCRNVFGGCADHWA